MKYPDPLTDASVEIGGIVGFILNTARLLSSELVALSTGDEFKAATLLWCQAWHQRPVASLPDDDRTLASFAGFGRDIEGWKKVRDIALRGFIKCSDGRFYHPVLAEDARRAAASRSQRKLAADKRWGNDAAAYAPALRADMQSNASGDAGAMPVQSSPDPSQSGSIGLVPKAKAFGGNTHSNGNGLGSGGLEAPDWSVIVPRLQTHGFTSEQAWSLAMQVGHNLAVARRMQGAMRTAEGKRRSAHAQIVSIAKEIGIQ